MEMVNDSDGNSNNDTNDNDGNSNDDNNNNNSNDNWRRLGALLIAHSEKNLESPGWAVFPMSEEETRS